MPRSDSYAGYRAKLVEAVRQTGIRDLAVLRAVGEVPRHLFVPPALRRQAYEDTALPIGSGQTISQPSTQARALEALRLTGREKVLEVGTGLGYQTALLAMVAGQVFSMERVAALAERARAALAEAGIGNVSVMVGDGTLGWRAYAPFEAMVVAAATREVPRPLLEQLAPGGRILLPLGPRESQVLTLITVNADGTTNAQPLAGARFVPLRGTHGFTDA
ncbi:MAG: protein-L-isoaspartate O-methyltransferase [Gemmatimonadetes bacterium GWC2_71_9]|nr:MAG: protein-L-isoaspartate O-methyltransferase [Gemmatimonadetes bacterium GWC2_71_9]